MKFTFQPNERTYLEAVMRVITLGLNVHDVDSGSARIIHKMRHKFASNTSYSVLTKRERALILTMLAYRLGSITDKTSDEAQVINKIVGVIK